MKKIVKLIYIALMFLIFLSTVKAYNITDSNNSGSADYSGKGSGSATQWLSVGGKSGTQLEVVRIRIFRNGSVISGMDKYYSLANDVSGCYGRASSVTHCTTAGYNYSSVKSTSEVSCSSNQTVNFGCIVGTNLGNSWGYSGGAYAEGRYLENYLEGSNYANLKSILAGMGYNNSNFNNDDIIIVEPATMVNCNNVKYFGTSTALMKKNVSYRGTSGNVCSGNDEYNGYTFENAFKALSKALSQNGNKNVSNSDYSGFGYFKYDVSGFGYVKPPTTATLTINKYDSVTQTQINKDVTVKIYSDSSCSTEIGTNGTHTFKKTKPITLNRGIYYIKETVAPTGYILNSTCYRADLSSGNNTVNIYNTPKGSLTINKVTTSNQPINSSVTMRLYNSTFDQTYTFSGGTYPVPNLIPGTYYLEEITPPRYYEKSNEVKTIEISAGVNTIVSFKNEKSCESEFNGYLSEFGTVSRENRQKLFEKYNQYQLLNFSNATATTACQPTRNCGNQKSYTCRGISLDYSTFNKDDLSCYLYRYKTESETAVYCSADFVLNTNMLEVLNGRTIKSGQLIKLAQIGFPSLNINQLCYDVYGNEYNKPFSLSDYITTLKINGFSDGGDILEVKNGNNSSSSNTFNTELTRKACLSKITGKEVDIKNCNSAYGEYYKGKYLYREAFIPKFSVEGKTYVYPYLEVTDRFIESNGSKVNFNINDNDKCVYYFKQDVIIVNKLNLEFRIIDTTNPFPGIYGTGRFIGSNWCDNSGATCQTSTIVDEKIKYAPNSKGIQVNEDGSVNSSMPKYKIELTSDVIKEIREYNNENSYEEINVNCVGNICKNEFLEEYKGYFEIFP